MKYKIIIQISLLLFLSTGVPCAQEEAVNLSQTNSLKAWKLAFVRNDNIWVANSNGTDQRLIIENGQSPSWSPDKKQIAFARDQDIWLAMADGSNQRPLTFQWKNSKLKSDQVDIYISWDPRHELITFSHQELFKIERIEGIDGIIPYSRYAPKDTVIGNTIFDVSVSGNEPKKAIPRYDIYGHEGGVSNYFVDQGFPSWSHSGKKLAFTRNGDIWIATVIEKEDENDKENYDITRVAAVAVYDEPTLRASRDNIVATNISWTPDEKQIIYSYNRHGGSGTAEVHLLDFKSGIDVNLFGNRAVISPNLSSDGQFVAYQSYECGKNNDDKVILQCVWVASLDGKVIQKIVDNAWNPDW